MLKKFLFIACLIALALGLGNSGEGWQWGLLLPLGAVFFILCFVVTVLEKEAAKYDEEHCAK
jgi:hypothetical protein